MDIRSYLKSGVVVAAHIVILIAVWSIVDSIVRSYFSIGIFGQVSVLILVGIFLLIYEALDKTNVKRNT